ncbi:hypothetical protein T07_7003 [Trichinella nelsoni]|uniref:Uncharacterized protein n=1 Tax=Trichinella nelsoni TaxID=6336 RepID=A0A0V0RZY9_9BILA|nr:hypothetical protein T07_7003 [Trichinella nelsoni]
MSFEEQMSELCLHFSYFEILNSSSFLLPLTIAKFLYPKARNLLNSTWQWKRPFVRIPLVVDVTICAILQ